MLGRPSSNVSHRILRLGLIVKAVDGALEAAGGLLLLFVPPGTVGGVVAALTQHELSEDPTDLVATHLRALAGRFTSDAKRFAVAYLLAHGLVKIALALGVLRGSSRVYPWALGFFLLFLAYEAYRLAYAPSAALAGFAGLDAAIVWLLWREQRLKIL